MSQVTGLFIEELGDYIAANSSFGFSSGDSTLKIGEQIRGENGLYILSGNSPEPESYYPYQYYVIDFFATNDKASDAYSDIQTIYDLFDRKVHFTTNTYRIDFAKPTGQAIDFDRDGENRKLLKLSVLFYTMKSLS